MWTRNRTGGSPYQIPMWWQGRAARIHGHTASLRISLGENTLMSRPKKLQTMVAEQVQKSIVAVARGAYADAILEKLEELGVNTTDFPIDAFVDHAIRYKKKGATFSWDGAPGPDRVVTIEFTKDEERDLRSYLEEISSPTRIAEWLQDGIQLGGEYWLKDLEARWPAQKLHEDSELYGFRKRLEGTWGEALDLYRIMLVSSRELFLAQAESLRKSRAKRNRHLREALVGIHARALRTATAVLVLLENGLADDAYTRWRTLYELAVIGGFLSDHGDDAAKRYLLHECVALKQRLDNMLMWGDEKVPKRQQRRIEKDYDLVISEYGKHFKNDYGWAGGFIPGNYNPKFVDIEKSVNGKRIAPPYKESSLQVHGGRAGLLGLGSSDEVTAIGPSNLGLEIPLMHSSFALMQVTNHHLFQSPSRDLVMISGLITLDRRIRKLSGSVARKLAKGR